MARPELYRSNINNFISFCPR